MTSTGIDLSFTQPCTFALRREDGTFGCCTKKDCKYAHSLKQHRIASCLHKERCRFASTTCRYIHPNETKESFYNRTTGVAPDLPEEIRMPSPKRVPEKELLLDLSPDDENESFVSELKLQAAAKRELSDLAFGVQKMQLEELKKNDLIFEAVIANEQAQQLRMMVAKFVITCKKENVSSVVQALISQGVSHFEIVVKE